jgi:hypothetical protein
MLFILLGLLCEGATVQAWRSNNKSNKKASFICQLYAYYFFLANSRAEKQRPINKPLNKRVCKPLNKRVYNKVTLQSPKQNIVYY